MAPMKRRPGARKRRGISKDAQRLADRVNELGDGWEATITRGGAHGGKAFVVTHNGEYVHRVSGHASYEALALVRAEASLRRAGCPLPRLDVTPPKPREELFMPRLTQAESAQLAPLEAEVRDAEKRLGRPALVEQAVVLIEKGAEAGACKTIADQNGPPSEMCEIALKRLLDEGKGWKQINIDRWRYVMENLNGAVAVVDAPEPPAPPEEPEPQPEPTEPDDEPEVAALLQAAEVMVKDAETARDTANAQVLVLEAQIANQEKALTLLTDSKDGTIKELEARLSLLREERNSLSDQLSEAMLAAPQMVSLESSTDTAVFRQRYFQVLTDLLLRGDTDSGEVGEYLRRLDALAGLGS